MKKAIKKILPVGEKYFDLAVSEICHRINNILLVCMFFSLSIVYSQTWGCLILSKGIRICNCLYKFCLDMQ